MKYRNMKYLFFVAFVFLVMLVMAKLLKPFAMIIFFAALFYIVLNPLYLKILGKKKIKHEKLFFFKRTSLALLFSFISILIFLIPVSLLGYAIIAQLIQVTDIAVKFLSSVNIEEFFASSYIDDILALLPANLNISFEEILLNLKDLFLSQFSSISGYLTQNLATILKGTGSFISSFIFMIFTLFFFFLDGEYIIGEVKKSLPIKQEYVNRLSHVAGEGIQSIVYGNLLTGLFQGFSGFVVFTLFGVKGSLMFGFLVMISSFIPIIGTSIIWIPLGLIMMVQDGVFMGLFLIIASFAAITLPDNFIRPLLLGGRIDLHPIFVFFSILAGIFSVGLAGIILGPLSFILFFEVMKIFNENDNDSANRKRNNRKKLYSPLKRLRSSR